MNIDLRSGASLKEQIVNSVKKDIAAGIYKSGDKIPTIREVAKMFGINPITVGNAYEELTMAGIIFSAVGRGSFVSDGDAAMNYITAEAKKKFVVSTENAVTKGVPPDELRAELESAIVKYENTKGTTANDKP
ncbi:MAG: GntR family transcriptional regulator [Oscillospiraceae bacterium]|jgi:GntR family transcriptional regulator|nr:GntR family transcriptional regulator [Oscillospiraceae bacterium]